MLKRLLFLLVLLAADTHAAQIVYSRQPRIDAPHDRLEGNPPKLVHYESNSQWQDAYDGGQPDMHSELDGVIADFVDGKERNPRVFYDCTSDESHICAVEDFDVSPDATRILFTVARGTSFVYYYGVPNFNASKYELWIHDIKTGKNTLIDNNARMGKWSGNNSIVFASNRAGVYPPWANAGPDYPAIGLHIFSATLNGTTLGPAFDLTPHAASAMSPAVNPDGTVAFSAWNGFGSRGFGHTPLNLYWIEQVNGNGTGHKVIMGAHFSPQWLTTAYLTNVCATDTKGQPVRCGEPSTAFRVLKGYVPLRNNRYAVVNYYRTNHVGGNGSIFICERNAAEGYWYAKNVPELVHFGQNTEAGSGQFVPRCYVATPFANDADNLPKYAKTGKVMGKVGEPFAIPQSLGTFGYTFLRGNCYSPSGADRSNTTFTGGEPTCKKQINIALVPRVKGPFNQTQTYCAAGCELEYNAFGARLVVPYIDLYNKQQPTPPPAILSGKTSTLVIGNAREGELVPIPGPNTKPYDSCAKQGCVVDGWQAKIAAIRIQEILPWLTKPPGKGFAGIGYTKDFPIADSGSVVATIPCNMTYQLAGVDADGNTVAMDNSLHPSVCGETVTCAGCHLAHKVD